MTQKELDKKIELHQLWLDKDPDGVKLDVMSTDLRGLDFSGADCRFANLSGANCRSAKFCGADFSDAICVGADFSDAICVGANFRGADFRNANFCCVNFDNTSLIDSNFREANLARSFGLKYAQTSFRGFGEEGRLITAVIINDEIIFFCGCFKGTHEEIIHYINEEANLYIKSRLFAVEFLLKALEL